MMKIASRRRQIAAALLIVLALAILGGVASAYLRADLRQSVVFSGLGLC